MDSEITSALVAYMGHGVSRFPRRDAEAVVERFGAVAAASLLVRIARLLAELDQLAHDWTTHSLISATEWAKTEMKTRHPELEDAALAALGWTFSYDWK